MDLADIASFADVFYIGGTKHGALLGEAIVIVNAELNRDFRRHLKPHGALLAKGRVLGVQFVELFRDDLLMRSARHTNNLAQELARGIKDLGYRFLTDSPTNQIFPIFPNAVIEKLRSYYGFYVWSKIDPHNSSIRLVTSWATTEGAIAEFLCDLTDA